MSRKELTDKLKPGSMVGSISRTRPTRMSHFLQGGTYAGNAVSCAAAIAVADAFKEENILANVQARCVCFSLIPRRMFADRQCA